MNSLAVETKDLLFLWLAYLNNKSNVCKQISSLYGSRYLVLFDFKSTMPRQTLERLLLSESWLGIGWRRHMTGILVQATFLPRNVQNSKTGGLQTLSTRSSLLSLYAYGFFWFKVLPAVTPCNSHENLVPNQNKAGKDISTPKLASVKCVLCLSKGRAFQYKHSEEYTKNDVMFIHVWNVGMCYTSVIRRGLKKFRAIFYHVLTTLITQLTFG